eukprot:6694691-Lingulodinium_polyedra.AAC.1
MQIEQTPLRTGSTSAAPTVSANAARQRSTIAGSGCASGSLDPRASRAGWNASGRSPKTRIR